MRFYQYLTYLTLAVILFIPKQLDVRIPWIIYGYSLLTLPIFLPKLKQLTLKKDKITLLFIVFLASLSVSTYFSIDRTRSLVSLGLYFAYFVVFITSRVIFTTFKSKLTLAGVLIALTTVLSVISLINTLVFHIVNKESNGVSFMWVYFGHNHLSALLIFTIPLTAYFLISYWQQNNWHHVFLIEFLILALSLIFTFGRLSIISLCIATMIILLNKKTNLLKLGFAAVLGLMVIISSFNLLSIPNKLGVLKYAYTEDTRLFYWKIAINNFLTNPLLGSGLDTFRLIEQQYSRNHIPNKVVVHTYFVHNYFLQKLSDVGIVSFCLSLLIIASLLAQARNKIKKTDSTNTSFFYTMVVIALFGSILNNLMDFDWQLPTIFTLFWLLTGI